MVSRSRPRRRHRPDMLKRSRSRPVRYARSNYADGETFRRVQANSPWDSGMSVEVLFANCSALTDF
jgi:hypothetical protein